MWCFVSQFHENIYCTVMLPIIKNTISREHIRDLFMFFSYCCLTMCSFYERESTEWPVKEDVVLSPYWMKFAIRYDLSLTPVRQKSPVSEAKAGQYNHIASCRSSCTQHLYQWPRDWLWPRWSVLRTCTLYLNTQTQTSFIFLLLCCRESASL